MVNDNENLLIEAIHEVIAEAVSTKKRVFNKAKLVLAIDDKRMPSTIYLTIAAEPPAHSGSIYLGEDVLIHAEDRFSTSVIDQCKLVEGVDESGTIQ